MVRTPGSATRTIPSGGSPKCQRPGDRSAVSNLRITLVPPDSSDEDPPEEPLSGQSPYGQDEASPFQADRTKPLVNRVFPVTEALPRYRQRSLQRDLIAGVTVAALA